MWVTQCILGWPPEDIAAVTMDLCLKKKKIHVGPYLFLLALLSERPACSTAQTA